MSTVTEILEQAKKLTREEREELARQLLTMPDEPEPSRRAKTGAEIVALLEAMDGPVEFVDPQCRCNTTKTGCMWRRSTVACR